MLVHHTFGIPKLAKYDKHFPAWPLGAEPDKTMPAAVFDALATAGKPAKTAENGFRNRRTLSPRYARDDRGCKRNGV